jgi:hypothetical protein
MLEEITLLEETNEYLKFKVKNLKILKLIDLIIESGKYEELRMVELEILIYCLKNLYPNDKDNLVEIIRTIDEFFDKKIYLEIEWNFRDFYNQISNLKKTIDTDKEINGIISSLKGSFHSDFDIVIS